MQNDVQIRDGAIQLPLKISGFEWWTLVREPEPTQADKVWYLSGGRRNYPDTGELNDEEKRKKAEEMLREVYGKFMALELDSKKRTYSSKAVRDFLWKYGPLTSTGFGEEAVQVNLDDLRKEQAILREPKQLRGNPPTLKSISFSHYEPYELRDYLRCMAYLHHEAEGAFCKADGCYEFVGPLAGRKPTNRLCDKHKDYTGNENKKRQREQEKKQLEVSYKRCFGDQWKQQLKNAKRQGKSPEQYLVAYISTHIVEDDWYKPAVPDNPSNGSNQP